MPDRPHIVLLMADHLRYDCLACYGRLGVRTPHLDALANESVVFDRAYCSTPLCIPTRTSMATGKWPHTQRVIVNGGSFAAEQPWATLGPEHRTYYEQLADGGYEISHVGIQHLRSVPPLAERVPRADINGGADHWAYRRERGLPDLVDDAARQPVPEFDNGRFAVKHYHVPTHVARAPYDAEDFMDVFWSRRMEEKVRAADVSRPRFWVLQLWAPHPPFFVPDPYFSMYDPADIVLPEDVGRWYEGMPPSLLLHTGAFRGASVLRDEWRRTWAAYFGLVSMVDDCIGRVVRAMKEKGFWDDALVVFTQDHGDCLGSHCMFQKMVMYDPSARIPLLVKPPGGVAGGRRPNPVGHVDIANTFCDYAGLPPMPGAWGSSLRPLIEDPAAAWRDATFSEFNGDHGRGLPTRAIMTGRFKYCHHFCDRDELYDMAADPLETRNLAADPAFQPVRHDLRRCLACWMRETDDVLDMDRDTEFSPFQWRRLDKTAGWQ